MVRGPAEGLLPTALAWKPHIMAPTPGKIIFGDSTYDCSEVDPIHMPTIERILTGTTTVDKGIDELKIPNRPRWLAITVRILRWYRRTVSPRLGNRCVFVPSCSRYAEMAFRNKGFVMGFLITCKRLLRCRAGSGGSDGININTGGAQWNTESNR